MPLYIYKCRECERVFEQEQKMTDPPLETHTCADGAVNDVYRVIGKSAVHFKGSGFYKTDYSLK